MRCLVRFLLLLVSLVYLTVGAVFLVLGGVAGADIWTPWTGEQLPVLVLVILVLGVIILVIGVLGMISSCCRSYSISYFFSFLVFFAIIFQVIGAILFIFFRFELENVLVESLKQSMSWYRDPPSRDSPFLSACGEFWDSIQSVLACCGVDSFKEWYETPYGQSSLIPSSCCLNDTSLCTSSLISTPSSLTSQDLKESLLQKDGSLPTMSSHYQDGCLVELSSGVEMHLIPLACSLAGLLVMQVLGMCFACCLARAGQVEDYTINY